MRGERVVGVSLGAVWPPHGMNPCRPHVTLPCRLTSRAWLAKSRITAAVVASHIGVRRGTRWAARCQEAEDGQRKFYGSFVRAPIRAEPVIRICSRCQSTQRVPCLDCSGTGRLGKGGYQKKNPISAARIIDSKWTAMERTFGWRHFRVTQMRKDGKEKFVLMVSTCDETSKFWLNMRNLRERERWASGWLQKTEIQQRQEVAGAECKACGGSGCMPCPLCSGKGGDVVEL